MPEIDNDLFKLLVVVLLALSTLLLLAALSALGGIRKLLKQQVDQTEDLRKDLSTGTSGTAGPLPAATSTGDETFEAAATPAAEAAAPEPSPATPVLGGAAAAGTPAESDSSTSADEAWGLEPPATTTPSPVGATDTPEDPVSTPAQPDAEDPFAAATSSGDDPFGSSVDDPFGTSTGSSATATAGDPVSSTSAEDPFASPASDSGAGSAVDPFGTQESADATSEESPFTTETPAETEASGGAATSGAVEEPEEQPFERNGKWFFRREGELLVYEEGTGEWIPADESALQPTPPPAATSTGYSTETPSEAEPGDVTGGQGGDTAQIDTVEPRPAAGGGFWKCPSCGAVNGSSATTCRMCFSARP